MQMYNLEMLILNKESITPHHVYEEDIAVLHTVLYILHFVSFGTEYVFSIPQNF